MTTTGGLGPHVAAGRGASASSTMASSADCPSGSGRPVGLFGLHSQTTFAPRAAARTPATSIA
jgi:hypothetical protein